MALTPATLDSVKPQVLHPRLAELWLIRCQTSLNSLIYGANFGNYVRVTDSLIDWVLFGGEFFGVQTVLHKLVGPGE